MTNAQKQEQQEYIRKLRKLLKPNDIVYTTVKHVSQSGMMRSIDVHIIRKNKPQWLSYWVARATGYPFDNKRESVKVGGCGMDMGFHLVYELSRILFPKGFKVKGIGRNGDTSGWDKDGGYALKQEWL